MKTIKTVLIAIAMICSAALVANAQGNPGDYDVTCSAKLLDVPITVSWTCCGAIVTTTSVDLGNFNQCQTKFLEDVCLQATVKGGRGWAFTFKYDLQMSNNTGFRIDHAEIVQDYPQSFTADLVCTESDGADHHAIGYFGDDETVTLSLDKGKAQFTLYLYKATATCMATYGEQYLTYDVTAYYN